MGIDQAILFESLHGLRFAVLCGLTFIFGQYLYLNTVKPGWRIAMRLERVQAAVAFFVYTFGETIWRGLVWANHGDNVQTFIPWLAFSTAGVISMLGAVCCLRVMLPSRWGWPTWLVMIAIAACVGVASFFV